MTKLSFVQRRFVLLVLIVALLTGCSDDILMHAEDASPGSIGDLSGSYVLNGIDPLGTEYAGRLDITSGSGSNRYLLQWIVPETVQQGTARLDGNTLIVSWQTAETSALMVSGTAELTVTVEGELYGSKRVDGDEGEWRETAYPIDAGDI